ncbi:MAG: cytochrome c biogenesis protein ResB [Elusimicrobia bacterium]|nr:cytochrome c biogenesis protein ResB [Elusimicrobiota bacterium]
MAAYLRLFRSVRFNIFLFAALALASAVGTLLPQAGETPEKVQAWIAAYPAWGRLFEGLGLFRLYESWWYLALLALMAFDIVVCKLASAPPDHGLVALPPELEPEAAGREVDRAEAAIASKPLQAALSSGREPEAAASSLLGALAREGYHVHRSVAAADGGRVALVATRHRAQRWGSYIAHVALVVILVGGLLKQLYGFVEMVPVLEGGSQAMQHKPDWELRVADFAVLYYDGTRTPKHFSSELEVFEGERRLAAKKIQVNDPLDIDGIRFYQATWGAGGMFRSVTLTLGRHEVQMPQRTPTKIPDTKIRVVADMLLPNFTIGPDGRADSGSLDLKNPGVRLKFLVDGRETRPLWLLQGAPQLAFSEGEDGVLTRAPPPPFALTAVDPVLFSGIQVAYDPGYPVVLGGGIAWLLGMLLLFYLHRRRLWIVIGPASEGGASVRVGAWSSRGPRDFQREFDALVRRLADDFGGTAVAASPSPAAAG